MTTKFLDNPDYLDVTGMDMAAFVAVIYDMSSPQGMGWYHYIDAPLEDGEVNDLVAKGLNPNGYFRWDYIKGRSVKMNLYPEDGRLYISRTHWYDHTEEQLDKLIKKIERGKAVHKMYWDWYREHKFPPTISGELDRLDESIPFHRGTMQDPVYKQAQIDENHIRTKQVESIK